MKSFFDLVKGSKWPAAITSVVGESHRALMLSRQLVAEIARLDQEDQARLQKWCSTPLPADGSQHMQIPLEMRDSVETIARHEIGHAVIARSMGFKTGDIFIQLFGNDGSHKGATTIFLEQRTQTISDVLEFIENRIVVLMAGTMSEAPSYEKVGDEFDEKFKNSISDKEKTEELIRLSLNIQGRLADLDRKDYCKVLRNRARDAVKVKYGLIVTLASQLANDVEKYGLGKGWDEVDFSERLEAAMQCKAP